METRPPTPQCHSPNTHKGPDTESTGVVDGYLLNALELLKQTKTCFQEGRETRMPAVRLILDRGTWKRVGCLACSCRHGVGRTGEEGLTGVPFQPQTWQLRASLCSEVSWIGNNPLPGPGENPMRKQKRSI